MKWCEYLLVGLLFILAIICICNLAQTCEELREDVDKLYEMNYDVIQKSEQLMRMNKQNLDLLSQGGWEEWK